RFRCQLLGLYCPPLNLPVGLLALHIGQHREIEGGRWRCRRPLKRPSVPRVARHVTQFVAAAYANNELDNLADGTAEQNDNPKTGSQYPWAPKIEVVMLQAPGHAEQARDIKRHKRDIEANKGTPEGCLAPTLMQPEAECFGKPINHARERTK